VARHLSNPDIFCLSHLRTQLASCGIASRDIVSSGPALDLKQPEGLLALNERLLQTMPTDGALPGFERIAPTVWAEPGVDVAATSRLIGTVVLHRNVHIRPNAVIVGPVVLAAGVTVGESAIVSRSVVGVDGRVPAAATLVNSVVAADAEAVRDSDVPVGVQWRSELFTPATHTPLTNGNGSAIGAAHTSRGHLLAKRVFDVVVALVALVLLSPIMFATALLVKLTSDGPVFFSHEREGKDGRIFRCCKFRTMVASAHAQQRQLYQQNQVDGPQFKMDRDPRITALGRVLRGTNIDELPQLFNVLRGEMSIIGPRPSPFRENQICVPWRRARLSVRPGITGLWQVCRHDRQVGDFHQWIYFDTLYVRHMSFSLDLKIMLATFLTGGGRWGMPVTWLIPRHRLLEALTPSEWEDAEVQGGFETPAETAPPAEAARQPVAAG
jgi:lipopolysaccharide/colanic/teichoic acid biosynthesis glycosyltransferase